MLQRVAYQTDEERLQRLIWPALDRVQGSEPMAMELMDGVTDIRVRFLDDEWKQDWPVLGDQENGELPRAVEITLITDSWGEIRRVFPLYP